MLSHNPCLVRRNLGDGTFRELLRPKAIAFVCLILFQCKAFPPFLYRQLLQM